MFGRFRKETPALHVYGKLPLAKDYLRVGTGKGSARELRDWMDNAYSSRAGDAGQPILPWPARFIIGAGPGEALMGSAWPSSDQGGERPFPFAVFVERKRKVLLQSLADGTSNLVGTWEKLEECYESHRSFADGHSFLEGMRGREIEVSVEHHAPPPRIDWEVWTRTLWPDDGPEGLIRALTSLARLATEKHRGPLRLPLVGDLNPAPQIDGWWTALVALELCSPSDLPTIFFPKGSSAREEPAFAAIFRSPLRVDDARWLSSALGQAGRESGDLASDVPRLSGSPDPVPENVPPLAESMRGALAIARSRA